MLLKTYLVITTAIILFSVRVNSQTPSFYHYTFADGLASSTVYEIIQDREGFIWFATANGISKFDGNRFTTFRTIDGLNSNSIISIAEGNNGELFIGNYEKGINVIKNNKIENYCSEIDGKSFGTSFLLYVDAEKEKPILYTYRPWNMINVIHEKTVDSRSDYILNPNPERIVKLNKLWNNQLVALTLSGVFNFENDSLKRWHIAGIRDTNLYCLVSGSDKIITIGGKGMIYRIKNSTVISQYKINVNSTENDVTSLLIDKNNNIWFSIMNRGFYLIPSGSEKIIDIGSKLDLQNTLVNYYLEDSEGNIWISTFGKGVYCLNNLYIKNWSEKDGLSNNNVYSIAQESSGKLLIGTFNGVTIFDHGKFDQVKSTSKKSLTEYIYSIKTASNTNYVCGTFDSSEMINISYQGTNFSMFSSPSFCKTSNGLYLFGTNANFVSVYTTLHTQGFQPDQFSVFGDSSNINRVNQIVEDSEHNIWIGTGLGLCKISTITDKSEISKWEKTFFPSNPVLSSKINSIVQVDENTIWFAAENGIAKYTLSNDSIASFTSINNYDLSASTSILSDHLHRLWVGNMKGLYLIDGDSVKYLNAQTGLPTDEVLSLCFNKDKNLLYIGTSNGISFLNIDQFDHSSPPLLNVKIFSVAAGDSVYTQYDDLVFKPNQNHVYIDFQALCFSSPGSVKYRYSLNGEWAETNHNFLDLVSLKHGTYNLLIRAKSQNTDWGKPYHLRFEVKPLLTETIAFKIGLLLLIVLIYISFVTWRVKLRDKKKREEFLLSKRINELKHQALSAMMNPHFIFNSLNSVQYLINSNRNEEANDYIAIMARLIRKNLDTSGSGMILLSDEISRLTLYLDLEKLRLQDGFTYEIIAEQGVEASSLLIPNMIIQPFVENTLWHGIIDSGQKGMLTVSFSFEEIEFDSVLCKSLIIKVTDNGIGINEARKHKKEDHISKGIQIIEERLRLLSAKMQIPPPIMIEDLSNRRDHTQGTEVIISLPPQLYKVILLESSPQSSLTV